MLCTHPRYRCALGIAILLSATTRADEPPKLQALRTQRLGDTTYFHVRFAQPADLWRAPVAGAPFSEGDRRKLARLPQLVPQDSRADTVYPRFAAQHLWPKVGFREPPSSAPIEGLEFVGKVSTSGKARFRLLYPTRDVGNAPRAARQDRELAALLAPVRWVEVPVKLDFAAAETVAAPRAQNGQVENLSHDLRRLWAEAQAAQLAVLEVLAPELGFYGFACAATGRKYGVSDPVLEAERRKPEEHVHRRALDLTTGTTAITQSLALNRLKRAEFRDYGPRTIDVRKVPGIDIAEHPWERMMAGQKPAAEPLAKLVPHDNYYLRFSSFTKFLELSDFLDQWGTNAARAYELNSRDAQIKQRYEQQLCLKSTWLGRQAGPWLIRGIAVTGSDPYLREGSDVTVLFHVNSRDVFLAGVAEPLREARAKFKAQLKESKHEHRGVTIEAYVTPLREVSVHRAAFGDFVVYSNSPVALRRVIDTYMGKHKSLWDSLDFQYMRTVFRADDKEEDGFGFLSDAFIRQLVGPASKIKEMRRLEALTSLSMLTHGAMFTAWETGSLPPSHGALMDAAFLRPEHVYIPEGKSIRWDPVSQVAVSDAYNTLHFATPLIELPIDKITALEDQTYRQFRNDYLQLWRQFFDPVGMRFSLNKERVKLEVYILPLINSREYAWIRNFGGGTTKFDPAKLSPRTLMQLTVHLGGTGWLREIGDWGFLRLDDGPQLRRLAHLWVRQDLLAEESRQYHARAAQAVFQLPITVGIGLRDPKKDAGRLGNTLSGLAGPSSTTRSNFRGTSIHRVRYGPDSHLINMIRFLTNQAVEEVIVYHCEIDGGFYVSFSKASIEDIVDRAIALRNGKIPSGKEVVPINASFHAAPNAAARGREALQFYLEWETHKRALPNNAAWYALYRGGLIDAQMSEPAKRAAALKFLGFIPVSPDDTAYVYDRRSGEVINERHGSLRRPKLHAGIAASSPLNELLEQFPNLRVDMRFREDGMHAIVTIARKQ